MNSDNEEEYEPQWGIFNPYWTANAISCFATRMQLQRAVQGLILYMQSLEDGECMAPDEVLDVMIQYLYAGEYREPFGYPGEEEPAEPITEDEIEKFAEYLNRSISAEDPTEEGDQE